MFIIFSWSIFFFPIKLRIHETTTLTSIISLKKQKSLSISAHYSTDNNGICLLNYYHIDYDHI